MIELGKRVQSDLKEKGRPGRDPEQEDDRAFPGQRDKDLSRVKSERRHDIDMRV